MTEIDVHNEQQLRYLHNTYEKIVGELNEAIQELARVKSDVQIADAKVKRLSNQKDLVRENILIEKKIYDALRR